MKCDVCGDPCTKPDRCDEHWKCDDCGTTEGLCYRLSGLRCNDCHAAFIYQKIARFEGDTDYTTAIICPWCGEEDWDSADFGDRDEATCGECEREFSVERHVIIEYSTKKLETP